MATGKREEPPTKSRWSAKTKADAVVRLMRGEGLDELSRCSTLDRLFRFFLPTDSLCRARSVPVSEPKPYHGRHMKRWDNPESSAVGLSRFS